MKKALVTIAVVAVLMVLSGVFGWYTACHSGQAEVHCDTVRTEVTDTIPYYETVPKDSVVIRYVTKVMPVAVDSETVADATDAVATDSAAVILPITQKKYEKETYRAYVSGYEPNLDSIFVYQKTITEKVVVNAKQPRFGAGVVTGVGYGLINKRPDVYVGLGFYMRW